MYFKDCQLEKDRKRIFKNLYNNAKILIRKKSNIRSLVAWALGANYST